jgi:hypothetical protein
MRNASATRRVILPRSVVDVSRGCAGVGVANPVLELADGFGLRDRERAEGVPEVVEPDRVEPRPLLRRSVAAARAEESSPWLEWRRS